jgi:hypothetical protein
MQTSNFQMYRSCNFENAVGVAGRSPNWYQGREYKVLAPKWWFFKKYKKDRDKEAYIKAYKEEVLAKLDPQKIFDDLGENATLLCWENSSAFCHRHLIADWLSQSLGIEIKEFVLTADYFQKNDQKT